MKYANVFSSFSDTATWNRQSDRHIHAVSTESEQRSLLGCEETGREMWVFGGVDGLERTTKAEASKISLFFYGRATSSNSFHMSLLYITKQTNMLFVHSAVLSPRQMRLPAVYNYTGLIVIIIK